MKVVQKCLTLLRYYSYVPYFLFVVVASFFMFYFCSLNLQVSILVNWGKQVQKVTRIIKSNKTVSCPNLAYFPETIYSGNVTWRTVYEQGSELNIVF